MKPVKNTTTLILMISSLALLLVLQVFWLFNSYEKAFLNLQKDIDGLFRTTVTSLRDSSWMQFIEKLPPDAFDRGKSAFGYSPQGDSMSLDRPSQWQMKDNSTQLSVFIRSTVTGDTLKNILSPIMNRVQDGKIKDANFVIRFGPDSIRIDSIRKHFGNVLLANNKLLPFRIIRAEQPHNNPEPNHKSRLLRMRQTEPKPEVPSIFSDTIKSDWIRTDPGNRYASTIFSVRPYLFRAITPEIFFSLFLTTLTFAAFFIMYRSMVAQQRLMTIKNDFISNITHELKTPITTVSVALEALRNFNGLDNPQRTEEYLNIAHGELNRLTILTEKILKTAIFENKGVHFEAEPVDLVKTMEQVLHSMKLVFEKQKAQISFEKTGDSFTIHGGSVHLTNVIYNLLDNALKYSEGEPRISVTIAEHTNRVTLKVADQGIGIPREYNKKIFEKFFRVPSGDVHNVKGYGLGLSYVESVIKSHHGNIEVHSESGKGSVFTVSLPKAFNSGLSYS